MENVAESEETLSDVIRLLVGELDEDLEITKQSVIEENLSAEPTRMRRITSEGIESFI